MNEFNCEANFNKLRTNISILPHSTNFRTEKDPRDNSLPKMKLVYCGGGWADIHWQLLLNICCSTIGLTTKNSARKVAKKYSQTKYKYGLKVKPLTTLLECETVSREWNSLILVGSLYKYGYTFWHVFRISVQNSIYRFRIASISNVSSSYRQL